MYGFNATSGEQLWFVGATFDDTWTPQAPTIRSSRTSVAC